MKRLLALLILVASISPALHAQWLDGGRQQSQWQKGNGALIVHEGDMYLWNEENQFQISTDNGVTWIDPPDSIGGANPHVARMSAAGGRVYAALNFGTGQGIPIYSTDKGMTWQPDTLGAPGHALGWGGRPVVSNIIAWGRWVAVAWDQPVPYMIKSFDGAWAANDYMNTSPNRPASWVAKGDTLFLAGTKVYYTTDGGATFTTPANNGFSGSGPKLFADGNRLYMFAIKGWGQPQVLYYSDDNAENWEQIDVSALMSRRTMNGDYYSPLACFFKGDRIEISAGQEKVNTPANIWKSTDLGRTWEPDTAGLPTRYVGSITSLAYTPDGTLWAAHTYENIYRQKIDAGTPNTAVTIAPQLLGPQQGGNLLLPAGFLWSSVANATSYQLQIATDTAFTAASREESGSLVHSSLAIVLDQSGITDTSYSVSSLAPASTYFWRVRGIGAGDLAGPWSSIRSFAIVTSGVGEMADGQLQIAPNPCHDRFTLRLPSGRYSSLMVCDLLGYPVHTEHAIGARSSLTVDISGLTAGPYWVILKGRDGELRTLPIVVQ